MAIRGGPVDKFVPIKGLVTEGNPGAAPGESAIDLANVEILLDGTVMRRLGFSLQVADEPDEGELGTEFATISDEDRSYAAYAVFLWENVAGIANLDLRVVQYGSTVKIVRDTTPLVDAELYATINLEDFETGGPVNLNEQPCEFAAGAGMLVITHRGIEPIQVVFSGTIQEPEITVSALTIEVRVQELLGPPPRQPLGYSDLSHQEEFDLRNTGWPFRADCANLKDGSDAVVIQTDPAAYFRLRMDRWPTVSVLYRALRLSNSVESATVGTFSPWEVDKIPFGNTVPPIGHYITNAFEFDSRALMEQDTLDPGPVDPPTGTIKEIYFPARSRGGGDR